MIWLEPFAERATQCWGCVIFDNLFNVVSIAGAAMYTYVAWIAIVLLAGFIAFYTAHSVWQNMYGDKPDPTYEKFRGVLINATVVLALLATGTFFPRMITSITIEPVANIVLAYSHAMLNTTQAAVEMRVPYLEDAIQLSPDGFFRPELRDTIVGLMQASTMQFQNMIIMGLYIMDSAFSWQHIGSIGAIVRHILVFFVGVALVWQFFKLFVRFCFYFVDVIINMAMFAFFFPLGLAFFITQNSDSADWVKKIGASFLPGMIKRLVNSIITLAVVIITYIMMMVLIARFFAASGVDTAALAHAIMSGDIYRDDISAENAAVMGLAGMVVLIYIVNYFEQQIPRVSESIISTFGFDAKDMDNKIGKEVGDSAWALGASMIKSTTGMVKTVSDNITGKDAKKEDKKEDKKEEGKEEKEK